MLKRRITIFAAPMLSILLLAANSAFGEALELGDVTASKQEREAAEAFVGKVMRAVEHYKDVNNALADGYFNLTPKLVGTNHYINVRSFTDDRAVDPAFPENLMYQTLEDGRSILVGVMFVMRFPGESGITLIGDLTKWHGHPGACWNRMGIPALAELDTDLCAYGFEYAPTPEMLHVWLVQNDAGVFDEAMLVNPGSDQIEAGVPEADPNL